MSYKVKVTTENMIADIMLTVQPLTAVNHRDIPLKGHCII